MLGFDDEIWAKNSLRGMEFFSHCAEDDILTLLENLEKTSYKAGAVILFQGEISNRFFIVRRGSVGIWKSAGGEKKMVAELEEGKYFGEISLMTPSGANATVKAQTDCEVLFLTSESFESAFVNDSEGLKTIQKKIEDRKLALSQPVK